MAIHTILVTGANGQLGWELGQLAKSYPAFKFVLVDRSELDLSFPETFEKIIHSIAPDCIINTAAYTAVDKSETEKELAFTVNATAVQELARICKGLAIPFITYSTDYVFNGEAAHPYLCSTKMDPVNYYGSTKAAGESMAMEVNENTIIIRTSWVFSSHGNNFVKTMMRLMKERESLNIVADQKGRPTYAKDLAKATLQMIEAMNVGKTINGVYHFANTGETTWFDFAAKIKAIAGLTCALNPIETKDFPTPAKRPAYSVLDTSNIEQTLSISIPHWEDALSSCMKEINTN
ncbi:MAG: dTDP-4-dehydrorhamnose reductase [Chitinophagia bacterium]|nr:dTDP-4-dehydrorhamnose reductase [Chitinophagia bacterium]